MRRKTLAIAAVTASLALAGGLSVVDWTWFEEYQPETIESFHIPIDHELYPFLKTFLEDGQFEDDACILDPCEVQLFDLPRTLLVRKKGVWNPRDYYAVWHRLRTHNNIEGKAVMDLGTGSGPLGLMLAYFGAAKVVATDINPAAVKNAEENAARLGYSDVFDVRLVSEDDPGAYAVIREDERFELIVSSPPADNARPWTMEGYSESDPGYRFVKSMIRGLPDHLTSTGSLWVLYAEPMGMRSMQQAIRETGMDAWIYLPEGKEEFLSHEPRELNEQYGVVIPVIEIHPPRSPSGARLRSEGGE